LRRWLVAIATHVTLDVVRHQGRRKALRIDGDLKGGGVPPSRAMRRKERRERLQNSLRTLSPDHRTVLELSRMKGLPIKEIAHRMGRTESAVKNLLLRATRKFFNDTATTESLGLDVGSSAESEVDDGQ
jgi:RNA polymerase sigma factor (sigma-70 family)